MGTARWAARSECAVETLILVLKFCMNAYFDCASPSPLKVLPDCVFSIYPLKADSNFHSAFLSLFSNKVPAWPGILRLFG